ncbi:carbohydrate ABC transporter permease [Paenarthrobacter sp. TYUT067]|uniref:carbohydrate ABC transporter permease n=1 Tax=Paenarthrobacter sp. TYUT067 TaxID=2926245 RepID=UPI00202E99E1|nr:carbohydrate ABC transporter permease [Paenarthrobacter sp. TYUT067]MCM0616828.1 carbohydrate ABC transporter permease [Paenarthrobacter sp. TYUT067]
MREIIVIAIALAMLIPFYFLIVMAFKPDSEVITTSAYAPAQAPTAGAFAEAWGAEGNKSLAMGMLNSIIITGGSVVMLVAIGSITAYSISRMPGRPGKLLRVLVLIAMILPFQLGMVPVYVAMRNLHLLGTYPGMIILYTGLFMPLAVFLYSGFAESIPRDYEEAANIDGASKFQSFVRVVFPLLGPATGTVAIMCGLIIWNDFFSPLIFLSGSNIPTLPVVVYSTVGELASRWNVIFAAVIISMIPILVYYLVAQKKFIQGFSGGLKS